MPKGIYPRKVRLCSVVDCGNKHFCKGFCSMHYQRMSRNGTTDIKFNALSNSEKTLRRRQSQSKWRKKNIVRVWKYNRQYNKKWRIEKPEEYKAHLSVFRAIKQGILIPQPCEKCGNVNVDAHHPDYSKPLEVVWLCKPCHKQEHKNLNRKENDTHVWKERQEEREEKIQETI